PLSHSIQVYEFSITVENSEAVENLQAGQLGGLNYYDHGLDFIVLTCPAPPGPADVVLLVHVSGSIIDPEEQVLFFLGPVPDSQSEFSPGYYPWVDTCFPFHPSSGSWDLPVAAINGGDPCAVIPRDEMSWSAVKTLYR
ncbi:hypothetical protein KKA85_06760, partial [bacterium]|nr:hypothetical protein [bacterium]